MGAFGASYLVLLIIVTRIISKFEKKQTPWYFEPTIWLSSMWIIGLAVYALPIYKYREDITLNSLTYILIAHTLFFIGTLVARVFIQFNKKYETTNETTFEINQNRNLNISYKVITTTGCLGIIGLAAIFADGLAIGTIDFAARLSGESLGDVRKEMFANAMLGASGPFAFFESFSTCAFVYVGLMITSSINAFTKKQQYILRTILVLSTIILMLNSLLIRGGRMDLVIMALYITGCIIMSPYGKLHIMIVEAYRKRAKMLIAFAIIFVLTSIAYFSTGFVKNRSDNSSPLVSGLYVYHRMEVTDEAHQLVKNNETAELALLTFSYVVVPMTTLSFYYELKDNEFNDLYWGQYNFQSLSGFLMRRLSLEKDIRSFWEIRTNIWQPLIHLGYGTNVWSTLLRDLAIDFGWKGALFVMFSLGFIAKIYAFMAHKHRKPEIIISYSYFCIFLLFSFAHSLFFVPSVFPPFVLANIFFFANRLTTKKSKKIHQLNQPIQSA